MAGPYIENYNPEVMAARGIKSQFDAEFGGDVAVTGALTVSGGTKTGVVSVTTASKTLSAAESGSLIVLNRAGGIAITLPAPAAGLNYHFVIGTNFTSNGTIVTNGGANIMIGGINELEVDTGDDGPSSTGADTLTFVNTADTVGDYVYMVSDGTSYFIHGQTALDGGITLTAS